MVYAATTFKYIFDYQAGDVYYCTADVGWVTGKLDSPRRPIVHHNILANILFFHVSGHSYIVYGPLCTGATSVMFEGVPTWPGTPSFLPSFPSLL